MRACQHLFALHHSEKYITLQALNCEGDLRPGGCSTVEGVTVNSLDKNGNENQSLWPPGDSEGFWDVGNLEGCAECHLDGLPGQIFLQKASSKFLLDDRLEWQTQNFLWSPLGSMAFPHCSHLPTEGKFHNYLPLNETFLMKRSAFLGTMSPSLQEQDLCLKNDVWKYYFIRFFF